MAAVCKFRSKNNSNTLIRETTQPKEYEEYELKLSPQQLRWVRGIDTHGVVEFHRPDYTTPTEHQRWANMIAPAKKAQEGPRRPKKAQEGPRRPKKAQEGPRRPKKAIHCLSGGHWTTPTGPFTIYHAPNAGAHHISLCMNINQDHVHQSPPYPICMNTRCMHAWIHTPCMIPHCMHTPKPNDSLNQCTSNPYTIHYIPRRDPSPHKNPHHLHEPTLNAWIHPIYLNSRHMYMNPATRTNPHQMYKPRVKIRLFLGRPK